MERLSHLIWRKRVRCLCSLLGEPMSLVDIQSAARRAWGWQHWLTTNVVAAGEGHEIRARKVRGVWLYGRVPGHYSATEEYGKALRKTLGTTIKATKRKPVRA